MQRTPPFTRSSQNPPQIPITNDPERILRPQSRTIPTIPPYPVIPRPATSAPLMNRSPHTPPPVMAAPSPRHGASATLVPRLEDEVRPSYSFPRASGSPLDHRPQASGTQAPVHEEDTSTERRSRSLSAPDRYTPVHNPRPLAPISDHSSPIPTSEHAPSEDVMRAVLRSQSQVADALSGIAHILHSGQNPAPSRSAPKAQLPEAFDGKLEKLEGFLFQCYNYFELRAKEFPDDISKVSWALTLLKGAPLNWFQSQLRSNNSPPWYVNFRAFDRELRKRFGPRDPEAYAMNKLENLRMSETGKSIYYSRDFNFFKDDTGWNDPALIRRYYQGLPRRIKDVLYIRGATYHTLDTLQGLVDGIDNDYWLMEEDKAREKRYTPTSGSTSVNTSQPAKPRSTPATSGSSTSAPSTSRSNPSSAAKSSSQPNPLDGLLTADGKLKPEERDRRFRENLCIICGRKDHRAEACPRRKDKNRPPAKARASTVDTAADSDSDPESEKA